MSHAPQRRAAHHHAAPSTTCNTIMRAYTQAGTHIVSLIPCSKGMPHFSSFYYPNPVLASSFSYSFYNSVNHTIWRYSTASTSPYFDKSKEFWKATENQVSFLDWLGKQLNYTSLPDWYLLHHLLLFHSSSNPLSASLLS